MSTPHQPLAWLNALDAAASDPDAPLAKLPLDDYLALHWSAASLLRDDLTEAELEERHEAAALVLSRFPAAIANYRLLLQQAATAQESETLARSTDTRGPDGNVRHGPAEGRRTAIASICRRGNSLEWVGPPPRQAGRNTEIARDHTEAAPDLEFVERFDRCELTVRVEPSGRRNFLVAVRLSWIAPDFVTGSLQIRLRNPAAGLEQSHPWSGGIAAFSPVSAGQIDIQVVIPDPQGDTQTIADLCLDLQGAS